MSRPYVSIFNERQYMNSDYFELYYYEDSSFSGVKNHTHDFSFGHQHEYYDSGDKLNTFGASPSSGTTGGPK